MKPAADVVPGPPRGSAAGPVVLAAVALFAGATAAALAGARFAGGDLSALLRPWSQGAALAAGTLVSEDLTCIAAGQLIRRAALPWPVGVFGCLAGIYVGDLGLWLAGRLLGRRVLEWPWLARRLPAGGLERLADWLDRRTGAAVLASRFLPGARLPLYVAAGALGRRGGRFALWTLVAAVAWTPLIVLGVAWLGDRLARPLQPLLGAGWLSVAAAVLSGLAVVRAGTTLSTAGGRARWTARLARVRQWEFWPGWLFYAPLVPWILCLSVRHRGFTTITAANPGIPDGGFVGESKFHILSRLDPAFVIPTALVEPAPASDRIARFHRTVRGRGWSYPLVLKPDVGQRGGGVRLVRTPAAAAEYLATFSPALLAQPFHPGPYEAGIFYYRFPGEPAGRIFSITDKRFAELVGDGVSTVEELVLGHPRYRLQAAVFLARHAGRRREVVPAGHRLPLAIAGNHCQGTMFLDGARLVTPALEARIDAIARSFDGFFFGRFDVRYTDPAGFVAGRDLAILELNGVTAESTNVYDPARGLLAAYRTLARQWSILFEIGAGNRRRGHRATPHLDLLRTLRAHYRDRSYSLRSD